MPKLNHWEDKDWGRTQCVCFTPHYSRHELQLTAGGYCSFHLHTQRANRFFVVSGVVRVVAITGWRVVGTLLTKGSELIVPSLVSHQFQVVEGGTMIEEYWPDRHEGTCLENDIERFTTGGLVHPNLLHLCDGVMVNKNTCTGYDLREQKTI